MMSGHLARPTRELEVVCLCSFLDCHWHHCCGKRFDGLVGRQMLGVFPCALLVLDDGLLLLERLVLELECLGHFW